MVCLHARPPGAMRALGGSTSPRHPVFARARGRQQRVVDSSSRSSSSRCSAQTPMLEERAQWAASVRDLTGRRKHRLWEPVLDPPALLADVAVVLVCPKRPGSVGTVARAASSFECEDLRLVAPRCDHLARAARNGSKGAQYLLWRAGLHADLPAALAGAHLTVAFTRWVAGREGATRSLAELLSSPRVAEIVSSQAALAPSSSSSSDDKGRSGSSGGRRAAPRLVLVFGREEAGLTPEELDTCDLTCSIPIGRLQESLSLSHAATVVLSQLFQKRQELVGHRVPQCLGELAEGFEEVGTER